MKLNNHNFSMINYRPHVSQFLSHIYLWKIKYESWGIIMSKKWQTIERTVSDGYDIQDSMYNKANEYFLSNVS